MNRKYIVFIGIILLMAAQVQFAQPRNERKALKKIDQLEKVKLLEILDMDEETSIKFFVRRKEFKEKHRLVQESMDSLQNQLKDKLLAEVKADYKFLIDELLKKEDEMHKVRSDYIRSQGDLLNDEQLAKLIFFEREFRRELQEILFKRGGKRARPDFE